MKCKIGDHVLHIQDVHYIPDLAESIYSLFLHIQCPKHGLHSSFEEGLYIVFLEFKTKALLGTDDIYLDAVPATDGYDYPAPIPDHNQSLSNDCNPNTDTFCRNVKQFHDEVFQECKTLDNLLKSLRRYYKEVKTKRQLSLEVPAGFRQSSNL